MSGDEERVSNSIFAHELEQVYRHLETFFRENADDSEVITPEMIELKKCLPKNIVDYTWCINLELM